MPNIDLSQFATIDDLKQLAKAIEDEITRRRDTVREEFFERAKQVAAELEIPIQELFETYLSRESAGLIANSAVGCAVWQEYSHSNTNE